MNHTMSKKEFDKLLRSTLTNEYNVELDSASNQQIYRALALICRKHMSQQGDRRTAFHQRKYGKVS